MADLDPGRLSAELDGTSLIGKLETAPVEVIHFDRSRPPAWLSQTARRRTLLD